MRGWRLSEFDALPEWEQEEYLAFDEYCQNAIDAMLTPIREGKVKVWDSSILYRLMLARLNGG